MLYGRYQLRRYCRLHGTIQPRPQDEARRFRGLRIADLFERLDIGFGERRLPTHVRYSGAEPKPTFGKSSGLQDGAHFLLHSAIVLCSADLQCAKRLLGEVADGDGDYDGGFRKSTALISDGAV